MTERHFLSSTFTPAYLKNMQKITILSQINEQNKKKLFKEKKLSVITRPSWKGAKRKKKIVYYQVLDFWAQILKIMFLLGTNHKDVHNLSQNNGQWTKRILGGSKISQKNCFWRLRKKCTKMNITSLAVVIFKGIVKTPRGGPVESVSWKTWQKVM